MAEEKVVGWFQGRMEFGPRALGARSILGDARSPRMQATMNLKIKFRESFRPFAPAVLRDHVDEFFEMRPEEESPHMLLVAPVHPGKRLDPDSRIEGLWGIDWLNVPRSVIPAVTHVDYSARVQTVDDARYPLFAGLLRAFARQTGCPVVVNTSFNVRGEPIVGSPADAYRCFLATDIDVLAMGRFVLHKANHRVLDHDEVATHLAQFQLD